MENSLNISKFAEPHDVFVYLVHVAVGILILALAITALSSRKGGFAHILSGRVFVAFSLVAGITALLFMNDIGFVPNIYGTSMLAMSIVTSSFLALRKPELKIRIVEVVCLFATFSVAIVLMKRNMQFVASAGLISEESAFTFACASFSLFFLIYDLYFLTLSQENRLKARLNRHVCGMAFGIATMVHAPIVSVFTDININFYLKFFGPYLIWPLIFFGFLFQRTLKHNVNHMAS